MSSQTETLALMPAGLVSFGAAGTTSEPSVPARSPYFSFRLASFPGDAWRQAVFDALARLASRNGSFGPAWMDGQKMSDEPQKKTGRTMNGKRTLKGAFIGVVLLLAGHAGAQDLVISTVSLTGGTPDGVAGDSTDNLYFAVGAAAVIWKMSPTGVIQTIAGQSNRHRAGRKWKHLRRRPWKQHDSQDHPGWHREHAGRNSWRLRFP